MRRKLTSELYLRFPDIFRGRNKPLTESLMVFGLECGDGWFNLIYALCEELEQQAILEKTPLPEAQQVKQKLGGLRFYVNGGTREMLNLIDAAETRSETLCEVYGDHAERFSDAGWIKTRCREHKFSRVSPVKLLALSVRLLSFTSETFIFSLLDLNISLKLPINTERDGYVSFSIFICVISA